MVLGPNSSIVKYLDPLGVELAVQCRGLWDMWEVMCLRKGSNVVPFWAVYYVP